MDQLRDPIYIAGPMTGITDKNIPLFDRVAADLRALGYRVENPADNGRDLNMEFTWEWYMRQGVVQLLRCYTIVLLPDWQRSKGATLERDIARTLAMDVFEWKDVPWGQVVPFRRPVAH